MTHAVDTARLAARVAAGRDSRAAHTGDSAPGARSLRSGVAAVPSWSRLLRAVAVVAVAAASPLPGVGLHTAATAAAAEAYGVEMMPYAKALSEPGRFESPRDYTGTVKYFRDKFKGSKQIRFGRQHSLPTVKYMHIENLNPESPWDGINIYQLPDGRVRIYVLKRVKDAAARP